MTDINNKELLLEAIDHNDQFSKSQKAVINIMLDFEKNGTTNISVNSITELTGFTKTIIYQNLKRLEKVGILKNFRKDREKIKSFQLHKSKLQEIIDTYLKKQHILQKKFTKTNKNS